MQRHRNSKGKAAIDDDRPLQAYVNVLVEAGPEAIKEAADQLRGVQRRLFDDYAREIAPAIIRAALKQWRGWGQMIIDADESMA